jgi:hypothetical protein
MPTYRVRSGEMDLKIKRPFAADAKALATLAFEEAARTGLRLGVIAAVSGGAYAGDAEVILSSVVMLSELGLCEHEPEEGVTQMSGWVNFGRFPPPRSIERLQWHDAAASRPDADLTVLLWIKHGTAHDWESGWWDGEAWRLCESGGEVAGQVLYFAEPQGPRG